MKTILFLCTVMLQSCIISSEPMYKVRNNYDPFFERKEKSVDIRLRSLERPSPINYASFYFVQKEQLVLYATFYKNPNAFYPEKNIYLKIDKEIHTQAMQNIEDSHFRTSSENKSMVMKADSTMAEVVQSVSQTDNYIVKCKIPINAEIEKQIRHCKSFSIRVNSGGKPSTFPIMGIDVLKKALFN